MRAYLEARMDQTALAERFNEVGRALGPEGYRVVVRRARQLLETGDPDEALALLDRTREVLEQRGEPAGSLAGALRSWLDAGGDTAALVIDPVWVEGSAAENRPRRLIEAATRGGEPELVASLVQQQRALSRGEPLARVPEAVVPKSALPKLPPLPRPPQAQAAPPGEEGRAEVARIALEAARRSRAVVEAPSVLTERPLSLDEEAAAEAPAPPAPSAPPPPVQAKSAPPPPVQAKSAEPARPEVAPEPPRPAPTPAAPPELERPPEMPMASASAAAKSGSGVKIAAALAVVAAAAAAAWFFFLKH
jgi:DNA polymerase-3 subunit gamma/tau